MLKERTKAPGFSLRDDNGKEISLTGFLSFLTRYSTSARAGQKNGRKE